MSPKSRKFFHTLFPASVVGILAFTALGMNVLAYLRFSTAVAEMDVPLAHPFRETVFSSFAVALAAGAMLFGLHRWRRESAARGELASAEQVLQMEAELRELFHHNPHPMWIYDLETLAFLDVNNAAVIHYGYSNEEFLNLTIQDIRPREDVQALLEHIVKDAAGFNESGIWRHYKKDGSLIHVEVSSHSTVCKGRRAKLVRAYDVTERVQAERKLVESEARLRLAVEVTGLALYDYDLRTQTFSVSPENASILGYAMEEFDTSADAFIERLHPEDRRWVLKVFLGSRRNHKVSCHYQYRQRTRSGDYKWLLSTGKFVEWDDKNRPTRFLGAHLDITQLKQAQEDARLQQAALSATANAVVITDPGGSIVWANPAFTRLTQYTLEEAAGKNPRELIKSGAHPEGFFSELWQTIVEGGVWRGEIINRRKDGTRYTEELSITPVRDAKNELTHFVAVKQDVTEKIAAQVSLREAQERLQRAVNAGNIGLWEWDPAKDQVRYSAEWNRQAGFGSEESQGRLNSWLDLVHEDDRDNLEHQLNRARLVPNEMVQAEYRFQNANEEYRWILMRASSVVFENGEPRVFGANIDISSRKRLEQDFAQSQKMESVGRLAGGVAHDFNNLLSVIGGYTEFLLQSAGDQAAWRQDLLQIKHASDRASDLTRQLLAFSRKQVLRPEVLNINRNLREIEKMLRRLIGEDIKLETHYDEQLWEVMADPGQIEQVLMNLVVNARDAMPVGGKLRIETRNAQLRPEAARKKLCEEGDYVSLTITDTGCGIPRSALDHVFDPFFTTKAESKGTGLGLATVYGIVTQSGGCIHVESKVGRGTTFEILLPRLALAPACAPEGQEEELASSRGDETILLVEDDEAVRRLTERMLALRGYSIIAAPNAKEAIRIVEQHDLDLVLSDVIMPEMSGPELMRRLKEGNLKAKVLFMSGYTDDALARHGLEGAEYALLSKPFTADGLAQKVREVLDSRAL